MPASLIGRKSRRRRQAAATWPRAGEMSAARNALVPRDFDFGFGVWLCSEAPRASTLASLTSKQPTGPPRAGSSVVVMQTLVADAHQARDLQWP